jgi:repressor LexA
MSQKLSRRQEEILEFVASFKDDNDYSPSLREIAEAFELNSVATVHQHVGALEKKGYFKKGWNVGRSIELTPVAIEKLQRKRQAPAPPTNVVPLERKQPWAAADTGTSSGDSVELPLLGLIAAGSPIEALENKESIVVPSDMVGRRETYVLKVRGNSMIGDGILDGDYVVVEKRDHARNGETVVALINNQEVTLKRFYIEAEGVRLQPANPAIAPIFLKNGDFAIQGVMIGLLRKLRH